ncbi:MAG: hypothetical protein ACLFTR_00600 [Candidatus Woesearchaeota archaeon]
MMNKTYFIIAFKEGLGILILRKKMLDRWELPKVSVSNEKPLNEIIEEFMHTNLRVSYRLIGQSSVVDSYEWPKELKNITGKEGEEHRFMFLEITGSINMDKLKSGEYSGYDLVDYELLVKKVVFKNHKTVLRKVIDELNSKRKIKDKVSENSGR